MNFPVNTPKNVLPKWSPFPFMSSGWPLRLKIFGIREQFGPSGFICEMCETERPLKGCYSAQAFEETFDVAFENRTYKAMKGYDEYLTNTYGNYMALPPEDQRTQHQFKAYYK